MHRVLLCIIWACSADANYGQYYITLRLLKSNSPQWLVSSAVFPLISKLDRQRKRYWRCVLGAIGGREGVNLLAKCAAFSSISVALITAWFEQSVFSLAWYRNLNQSVGGWRTQHQCTELQLKPSKKKKKIAGLMKPPVWSEREGEKGAEMWKWVSEATK